MYMMEQLVISGYMENLKSSDFDGIMCSIDDKVCKKVADVLRIDRKILLIDTCPKNWSDVFDRFPGSTSFIQTLINILIEFLIQFKLLPMDDRAIVYNSNNLYLVQCSPETLAAKPHFDNIIPVGTFFQNEKVAPAPDHLKKIISRAGKVVVAALPPTSNKDSEIFLNALTICWYFY
jgi:hypothetical protein